MRSTFKLTLAALAVSLVLSGCKSSQGPSVVAKNANEQVIKLNEPPKAQDDQGKQGNERENDSNSNNKRPKPVLPKIEKSEDNLNPTPSGGNDVESHNLVEEDTSGNSIQVETEVAPISEDPKGQAWRVVPLSQTGSLVNVSNSRGDYSNYRLSSEKSPLGASQDFSSTEYNYSLGFELGQNTQGSRFIKTLNQRGEDYLGQHKGLYQDPQLVGDSQKLNYLYVNQPYSSYGALFTDANNSNLFHVQLKTGRDSRGISEEGEDSNNLNSAEYIVYTAQGKGGRWNSEVLGDAKYKGSVIARVEKQVGDKTVIEAPKADGDVTLNLHLDNNWDNNRLSGTVNSTTLGEINLESSKLAPANLLPAYEVSFYGTASVANDEDLEGEYSTTFVGPRLSDAVGSIELEKEDAADGDVIKYDAVFGAMKTEQ